MPILNADNDLTSKPLYEGQVLYWKDSLKLPARNSSVILPGGRALTLNGTTLQDQTLRVQLPVNASSVLWAMSVMPETVEKRDGYSVDANGNYGWPANYPNITILLEGVIGVKVVEAVLPTDPVFWIHTPGVGEEKGQFRNDANTATAVAAPNCRFLWPGSAGDIIPLYFRL